MANEVEYLFNAEAIRKLLDLKPDYFIIRTGIEPRELNGEAVGVVTIVAEAYSEGKMLLEKTEGCPIPPCAPR